MYRTRVYYNNVLACFFCPPFLLIGAEYAKLFEAFDALLKPQIMPYVVTSCLIGIGISFTGDAKVEYGMWKRCIAGKGQPAPHIRSGFGFRNYVTATTFTVVGVMNKLLTVFMSAACLPTSDPSALGVTALVACIGGGALYRQAPPRKSLEGACSS